MDSLHTHRALGRLILALALAPALLPAAPTAMPPLEPPADPRVAVGLGWPLSPGEGDPSVWSALPGIGPARAAALSSAACAGALSAPEDLLRVPGFGIKMAAVVAERVSWRSTVPSSSTCTSMAKAPQ